MALVLSIVGAIVGLLIELATPWSDIIMNQVNVILADTHIHEFAGLSPLVTVLGIFFAYLFMPGLGFIQGIVLSLHSDA